MFFIQRILAQFLSETVQFVFDVLVLHADRQFEFLLILLSRCILD